MHNASMMAIWTTGGNFDFMSTEVASELVGVGMEIHRNIAIWAEGLPAAVFADCHGGRTTTIMKNQSLMISLKIVFDFCQKLVRKIAILAEIITITEVDDGNFWLNGGGFSLSREFNEGVMRFGEVKIYDVRCSGTINAEDFTLVGHKTGKSYSGIAGCVFLIIGTFVGFVDKNKAEVINRGEEGGPGANYN